MTAKPLMAPRVIDLGRLPYTAAYQRQCEEAERVAQQRNGPDGGPGVVLLVEHDPVITISRRAGAGAHLVASRSELDRCGVGVEETDRGGDITYHGPGQLVVYPILDLNWYGLRIHDYMRLLEGAVIDACVSLGVPAHRDRCATGVWIGGDGGAKLCAMGVRVRRWVSMHGLALNVSTNLDHFRLIVPCGLAGRTVTSLSALLGDRCPSMPRVKALVTASLLAALDQQREQHQRALPAHPTSVRL